MSAAARRWPEPTWAALIGFGLLTRLAVVLAGVAVAAAIDAAGPFERLAAADERVAHHVRAMRGSACLWVEPFYRWDAIWYADVAAFGYRYTPGEQSSAAFMPLLPGLMAAAERVLGLDPYLAGLLVPNLAFAAGLGFFGRSVLLVTGEPAKAWGACVTLTCYPFAIFFSLPYTESLFFLFSSAGLWAWLRDRPAVCALACVPATWARLAGVVLPLAVLAQTAWDWWRGRTARRIVWAWLPALGVGLAFASYLVFMHYAVGDAWAGLRGHGAWGRESPSLLGLLRGLFFPTWPAELGPRLAMLAVAWAALLLGAWGWWKRGPLWGCLIVLPVLQAAATGTPLSMQRVVLSAYPAALEVAELVGQSSAWWMLAAAGAVMQVVLLAAYMRLEFIG